MQERETPLLNVDQLAQFLGVTVNVVHGLTRSRAQRSADPTIPHLKIGKRCFFRRESVLRWLEEKEAAR